MLRARKSIASFVLLGLLFALQGPLLAQLRPAAAMPMQLCTAYGLQRLDGGGDAPSAPRHASPLHCAACAVTADVMPPLAGDGTLATQWVRVADRRAHVAQPARSSVFLARLRAQPPPALV